MAEAKQPSFEELIGQIDSFEKTLLELSANVAKLRKRLLENKEKHGPDIAKWPKEEK